MKSGKHYGRLGFVTQARKDRHFINSGGLISFIALNELKPHGQRYWILRDMFERIGSLVVCRG